MRTVILAMISALFAISCAPVTQTSGDAVCDATRAARADLARALADSPDDKAVIAGARLKIASNGGQPQAECIGEVVARVGYEGEALRPDSSGCFAHHKQKCGGERDQQNALPYSVRVMVMSAHLLLLSPNPWVG